MRNTLAAIIFYSVSILLLPASAAGYILWVARLLAQGGKSGISSTAQGPLSARWMQHHLGVRPDEPANRLMMVVPGVSPLAVWLVFGPTLIAHRLSGFIPKIFRYPFKGEISLQAESTARQTFFDGVVDHYLPHIPQFVILGAGFDTRAFRLPKSAPVRSFEVDKPQTQAIKRQILAQANIDTSSVILAPADFEKEDWLERLIAAGFDPTKPALYLWKASPHTWTRRPSKIR